jgi:hypothetical protein
LHEKDDLNLPQFCLKPVMVQSRPLAQHALMQDALHLVQQLEAEFGVVPSEQAVKALAKPVDAEAHSADQYDTAAKPADQAVVEGLFLPSACSVACHGSQPMHMCRDHSFCRTTNWQLDIHNSQTRRRSCGNNK